MSWVKYPWSKAILFHLPNHGETDLSFSVLLPMTLQKSGKKEGDVKPHCK